MGRFLFATVILSICSSGCAPTDPTARNEDDISGNFPVGTQLVTIEDAAMHAEPDANARIIQVIPKGTRVQSGAAHPLENWYGITANDKTGWVAGRWLAKAPIARTLDVPYECQNTNGTPNPSGTCQLTSASMVLRYWSRKGAGSGAVMANGLFARYVAEGRMAPDGADAFQAFGFPSAIAGVFQDFGLHSKATTTGTRAEMKAHLDAQRPLVVHGFFTTGHVLVFTGYDANGWFVNDPNGQWNGTPNVSGAISYAGSECPTAGGKSVHLSKTLLDETDVIGHDGTIWFSTADKDAF